MDSKSNQPQSLNNSSQKRILFIITQSEIGGAQQFLHTLVNRLDKNLYEILISAGTNKSKKYKSKIMDYELLDKLERENFKVRRLKHLQREIKPLEDFRSIFEIKNLIKEFQPNTLFLLSSKAGFIGSLAALLRSGAIRPKVIYRIGGWSFNDPGPKWKKILWRYIEKISSNWKDFIIVNNRIDFEQAKKLRIQPRKDLILVYNGIDTYKLDLIPPQEARLKLYEKLSKISGKIFQSKIIIGTIANFYPAKGLSSLIEATEYFKQDESVIFIIIGDGMERQILEKLIKAKGLEHTVFLSGQISDAKRYLGAFDIFVLSSLKEGFPWALIEAMAAKLPVIATKVGAIPEIIENGKNGFTVEAAKPEQIVEKIKLITSSEYLKQELGIQAHQTILHRFSVDKMIREIEEIIN